MSKGANVVELAKVIIDLMKTIITSVKESKRRNVYYTTLYMGAAIFAIGTFVIYIV